MNISPPFHHRLYLVKFTCACADGMHVLTFCIMAHHGWTFSYTSSQHTSEIIFIVIAQPVLRLFKRILAPKLITPSFFATKCDTSSDYQAMPCNSHYTEILLGIEAGRDSWSKYIHAQWEDSGRQAGIVDFSNLKAKVCHPYAVRCCCHALSSLKVCFKV